MRRIKRHKKSYPKIILPVIGCFLFMTIGYSVLTTTLDFNLKANKGKPYEFSYTGGVQTFRVPKNGVYQVELWGASGGDFIGNNYYKKTFSGGNGAYTTGNISLTTSDTLYIYIGGKAADDDSSSEGGYNGGGAVTEAQMKYGRSGGGATDIRLTSGEWDNFNSLKSRIMVAAGGGGANNRNDGDAKYRYGAGSGGAGGELVGVDGETIGYSQEGSIPAYTSHSQGIGGTQTAGGYTRNFNSSTGKSTDILDGGYQAAFGIGVGVRMRSNQAGGGSGYYGGGASSHGAAAGGSSFISGHSGCNAISSTSTETNITHTGNANHYSGKVFTETQMIAGNKTMPNYKGGTMVGNDGNGYARITYLRPAE